MIYEALLRSKSMMPGIISMLEKQKDTQLMMAYRMLIK
jgi:hypothetical protein